MKNNRGSLTITALFTVLMFSLYGILLYARSASSYIRQTKSIETIQAIYAQDVPNAARIAEQMEASSSEIYEDRDIKVTFNANGGSTNVASKKVKYGEAYGNLPVPTREGYTFKGWNGKNMVHELIEENFGVYNHYYNTSSDFFNENNTKYIRINGNPSNQYIDTLWWIYDKNKIILKPNNKYVLSFYVRSENSIPLQIIKKRETGSTGRTGIYAQITQQWDEVAITTIEEDFSFENDGNWHRFTSRITIPNGYDYGYLEIGNDIPNIFGSNSYLDIKSIQLEEGDIATEYEPYYINSSTKVVQQNNHILTAIWEKN